MLTEELSVKIWFIMLVSYALLQLVISIPCATWVTNYSDVVIK